MTSDLPHEDYLASAGVDTGVDQNRDIKESAQQAVTARAAEQSPHPVFAPLGAKWHQAPLTSVTNVINDSPGCSPAVETPNKPACLPNIRPAMYVMEYPYIDGSHVEKFKTVNYDSEFKPVEPVSAQERQPEPEPEPEPEPDDGVTTAVLLLLVVAGGMATAFYFSRP